MYCWGINRQTSIVKNVSADDWATKSSITTINVVAKFNFVYYMETPLLVMLKLNLCHSRCDVDVYFPVVHV